MGSEGYGLSRAKQHISWIICEKIVNSGKKSDTYKQKCRKYDAMTDRHI